MGKKKRKSYYLLEPEEEFASLGDSQNQGSLSFLDDALHLDNLYCDVDTEGTESRTFPNFDRESNKIQPIVAKESEQIKKQREPAKRSKSVSEYDVAMHLVENYQTGLYQNVPYIKINGVDTVFDQRLIGSLIEKSMPYCQKTEISGNSFKHIYAWLQAILDGQGRILQRYPHLILFENGIYNFLTGERVSESQLRNAFFPVKIHGSYFPDDPPETPTWDKFILDCTAGDNEISQLIHEYVGYMISPCEPDQFFLLAPKAGSGKSVLGNMVRELLGKDKTCAVALSNFGKSFELSQIYGKVGSFCLDITSSVLPDPAVSTIKRLTGGDPETMNIKYKDPFPYNNYAKLTFACNENGIRLKNPDSGFERRLVVVPFLHSIPREQMDKDLKNKLWRERDGIICRAISALRILHRNSYCFSYCQKGEMLKRNYMGTADPSVQEFIDEVCSLSPEERAWTSELYKEYLHYCQENGMEAVTRRKFGNMIYSVPGVRKHKFQQNHIQLQGADGICLKR